MRRREFHIGPGAASLLMIAVVLSLSVLGMLSLISARSDGMLADRSVEVAAEIAGLNIRAEESLANLDAALAKCTAALTDEEYLTLAAENLPGGMHLDGRTVCWTEETESGKMLECAAEILPLGSFPRAKWTIHRMYPGVGGFE